MKKLTKNQLRLIIIANASAGIRFSINIYGQSPTDGYVVANGDGQLTKCGIVQRDVDDWIEAHYSALYHNPSVLVTGHGDKLYSLELSKHMRQRALAINYADRYDQPYAWDVAADRAVYQPYAQSIVDAKRKGINHLSPMSSGLNAAQIRQQEKNIAKWQRGEKPVYRIKN